MNTRVRIAILLAALSAPALAQEGNLPPAPTLKDLAWIEGHWTCSIWGGTGEEVWMGPGANTMLGMFRHYSGDKITVYELIELQQEPAGPVMRIKHFRRGMTGIEDKDQSLTLPLRNWNGNEARFETEDKATEITYTRSGADRMEVVLRRSRNGKTDQQVFKFARKP